jgi:hypothetical protein
MLECQSCGGRYDPIGPDGLQYFHRCPPLSAPELAKAVKDGRITLPEGETVEDAVQRRTYERANLRDENAASTKAADGGKPRLEGDGVLVVVSTTPAPVVVVPK